MTASTENDNAALQGGFDFSHDSGSYVGYWGSKLGYGNTDSTNGFENDFYAGYEFSAGAVNINVDFIHLVISSVGLNQNSMGLGDSLIS